MASYRPFPPPSSFRPPSQSQNPAGGWNYGGGGGGGGGDAAVSSSAPSTSFPQGGYNHMPPNSGYNHAAGYGSSTSHHYQQYPYPPPPPPPPETSYPPPPPPPAPAPSLPQQKLQPSHAPPMYYPPNHYSQYNQQQPPPPPPPSSPPPSSSIPPPPPPSSPPPPASASLQSQRNEERQSHDRNKGKLKEASTSARREHEHSNRGIPHKQQKPAVAPMPMKKSNGPPGRAETEEERRLRKKREFEKQRQEEKHKQQLKESQNSVMPKTQISGKGHGSVIGSRMGEKRTTPLLSSERIENRLKKPTTFLCKMRFRNELPDPSAQPKLMAFKKDKDEYAKYTITSLEKMYKPKLFVEPDLGIPLDLLDLSVYNPPSVRPPLEPEDEELLRDDEVATPIKKGGIKRKERPTDKGVAWLVKTQYISPISMESTKQSLTEKQAKELREMKGRNILENLNNRERQIKEIEASFEAAKSHPVHATNKDLYPVEILPLLPDFDRYDDQFVVAAFDNAPTADSENYNKLDKSTRDAHESQVSYGSKIIGNPANPEKFLAYMVPAPGELSKDIYDENEDISYSWVREYHWDVRGDDAHDPTTYLVSLDESEARYLPLPTKLVLRKKRAREGRSGDEVEQFPIPSRLTVRRRPNAAAIELVDSEAYNNTKGGDIELDDEDDMEGQHRVAMQLDNYQSSGAEDDMYD
ncbi:Protein PAF1 [Stylosanthes scabra]|uniref:Protein PAF1 n=1 Tax=Stylosanthes scabra TaxID=79078 RepID=A0ABU6SQ11_9FABA|nr:Protein PAF1 [Stylosanthes scabra]